MFGIGSISKFLMINEADWQSFKDSVDELRSAFPGLHQEPQDSTHASGSDSGRKQVTYAGPDRWQGQSGSDAGSRRRLNAKSTTADGLARRRKCPK